jgi:hypothetical protein
MAMFNGSGQSQRALDFESSITSNGTIRADFGEWIILQLLQQVTN